MKRSVSPYIVMVSKISACKRVEELRQLQKEIQQWPDPVDADGLGSMYLMKELELDPNMSRE